MDCKEFREIKPSEITQNPFEMIGKQWALLTAGDETRHNAMTISWGQLGIMWNLPVANVYVRPQRYTRGFTDAGTHFSLSFFDGEEYRPALQLLGTKSGRDGDKVAEAGLHTQPFAGVPAFAEAAMVLVCRKVYQQDLTADGFVDKPLGEKHYPAQDYHRMYIGEIEKVFVR